MIFLEVCYKSCGVSGILWHIVFNVFVIDLEEGRKLALNRFADNTNSEGCG